MRSTKLPNRQMARRISSLNSDRNRSRFFVISDKDSVGCWIGRSTQGPKRRTRGSPGPVAWMWVSRQHPYVTASREPRPFMPCSSIRAQLFRPAAARANKSRVRSEAAPRQASGLSCLVPVNVMAPTSSCARCVSLAGLPCLTCILGWAGDGHGHGP